MNTIVSIKESLNKYTNIRIGETKLGEKIPYLSNDIENIESILDDKNFLDSKYILLGIPEDIGVRANGGQKGTRNAFDSFLKSFVNIQSNQFMDTSRCYILGNVYVEDLLKLSDFTDNVKTLKELCQKVDDRVFPIIQKIKEFDKIPIIIGGGHNNSFPIIKGVSKALNCPIEVLNIDPHADFRALEGRHSGNGFSYAFNENYLSKYSIFGLHQSYNNQYILDSIESNSFFATYFEEILFENKTIKPHLDYHRDTIGLEIDLDSIKNMPSSAMTPSGLIEEDLRKLVFNISQSKKWHYIHICEAISDLKSTNQVGKFISYLVSDILKQ